MILTNIKSFFSHTRKTHQYTTLHPKSTSKVHKNNQPTVVMKKKIMKINKPKKQNKNKSNKKCQKKKLQNIINKLKYND